ncbi:hypothetical protein E4T43_06513 [Aureobasidium subglaciale]|nr:hypothetical protein E4T43_06513 [Aureobasidium subglaciale]
MSSVSTKNHLPDISSKHTGTLAPFSRISSSKTSSRNTLPVSSEKWSAIRASPILKISSTNTHTSPDTVKLTSTTGSKAMSTYDIPVVTSSRGCGGLLSCTSNTSSLKSMSSTYVFPLQPSESFISSHPPISSKVLTVNFNIESTRVQTVTSRASVMASSIASGSLVTSSDLITTGQEHLSSRQTALSTPFTTVSVIVNVSDSGTIQSAASTRASAIRSQVNASSRISSELSPSSQVAYNQASPNPQPVSPTSLLISSTSRSSYVDESLYVSTTATQEDWTIGTVPRATQSASSERSIGSLDMPVAASSTSSTYQPSEVNSNPIDSPRTSSTISWTATISPYRSGTSSDTNTTRTLSAGKPQDGQGSMAPTISVESEPSQEVSFSEIDQSITTSRFGAYPATQTSSSIRMLTDSASSDRSTEGDPLGASTTSATTRPTVGIQEATSEHHFASADPTKAVATSHIFTSTLGSTGSSLSTPQINSTQTNATLVLASSNGTGSGISSVALPSESRTIPVQKSLSPTDDDDVPSTSSPTSTTEVFDHSVTVLSLEGATPSSTFRTVTSEVKSISTSQSGHSTSFASIEPTSSVYSDSTTEESVDTAKSSRLAVIPSVPLGPDNKSSDLVNIVSSTELGVDVMSMQTSRSLALVTAVLESATSDTPALSTLYSGIDLAPTTIALPSEETKVQSAATVTAIRSTLSRETSDLADASVSLSQRPDDPNTATPIALSTSDLTMSQFQSASTADNTSASPSGTPELAPTSMNSSSVFTALPFSTERTSFTLVVAALSLSFSPGPRPNGESVDTSSNSVQSGTIDLGEESDIALAQSTSNSSRFSSVVLSITSGAAETIDTLMNIPVNSSSFTDSLQVPSTMSQEVSNHTRTLDGSTSLPSEDMPGSIATLSPASEMPTVTSDDWNRTAEFQTTNAAETSVAMTSAIVYSSSDEAKPSSSLQDILALSTLARPNVVSSATVSAMSDFDSAIIATAVLDVRSFTIDPPSNDSTDPASEVSEAEPVAAAIIITSFIHNAATTTEASTSLDGVVVFETSPVILNSHQDSTLSSSESLAVVTSIVIVNSPKIGDPALDSETTADSSGVTTITNPLLLSDSIVAVNAATRLDMSESRVEGELASSVISTDAVQDSFTNSAIFDEPAVTFSSLSQPTDTLYTSASSDSQDDVSTSTKRLSDATSVLSLTTVTPPNTNLELLVSITISASEASQLPIDSIELSYSDVSSTVQTDGPSITPPILDDYTIVSFTATTSTLAQDIESQSDLHEHTESFISSSSLSTSGVGVSWILDPQSASSTTMVPGLETPFMTAVPDLVSNSSLIQTEAFTAIPSQASSPVTASEASTPVSQQVTDYLDIAVSSTAQSGTFGTIVSSLISELLPSVTTPSASFEIAATSVENAVTTNSSIIGQEYTSHITWATSLVEATPLPTGNLPTAIVSLSSVPWIPTSSEIDELNTQIPLSTSIADSTTTSLDPGFVSLATADDPGVMTTTSVGFDYVFPLDVTSIVKPTSTEEESPEITASLGSDLANPLSSADISKATSHGSIEVSTPAVSSTLFDNVAIGVPTTSAKRPDEGISSLTAAEISADLSSSVSGDGLTLQSGTTILEVSTSVAQTSFPAVITPKSTISPFVAETSDVRIPTLSSSTEHGTSLAAPELSLSPTATSIDTERPSTDRISVVSTIATQADLSVVSSTPTSLLSDSEGTSGPSMSSDSIVPLQTSIEVTSIDTPVTSYTTAELPSTVSNASPGAFLAESSLNYEITTLVTQPASLTLPSLSHSVVLASTVQAEASAALSSSVISSSYSASQWSEAAEAVNGSQRSPQEAHTNSLIDSIIYQIVTSTTRFTSAPISVTEVVSASVNVLLSTVISQADSTFATTAAPEIQTLATTAIVPSVSESMMLVAVTSSSFQDVSLTTPSGLIISSLLSDESTTQNALPTSESPLSVPNAASVASDSKTYTGYTASISAYSKSVDLVQTISPDGSLDTGITLSTTLQQQATTSVVSLPSLFTSSSSSSLSATSIVSQQSKFLAEPVATPITLIESSHSVKTLGSPSTFVASGSSQMASLSGSMSGSADESVGSVSITSRLIGVSVTTSFASSAVSPLAVMEASILDNEPTFTAVETPVLRGSSSSSSSASISAASGVTTQGLSVRPSTLDFLSSSNAQSSVDSVTPLTSSSTTTGYIVNVGNADQTSGVFQTAGDKNMNGLGAGSIASTVTTITDAVVGSSGGGSTAIFSASALSTASSAIPSAQPQGILTNQGTSSSAFISMASSASTLFTSSLVVFIPPSSNILPASQSTSAIPSVAFTLISSATVQIAASDQPTLVPTSGRVTTGSVPPSSTAVTMPTLISSLALTSTLASALLMTQTTLTTAGTASASLTSQQPLNMASPLSASSGTSSSTEGQVSVISMSVLPSSTTCVLAGNGVTGVISSLETTSASPNSEARTSTVSASNSLLSQTTSSSSTAVGASSTSVPLVVISSTKSSVTPAPSVTSSPVASSSTTTSGVGSVSSAPSSSVLSSLVPLSILSLSIVPSSIVPSSFMTSPSSSVPSSILSSSHTFVASSLSIVSTQSLASSIAVISVTAPSSTASQSTSAATGVSPSASSSAQLKGPSSSSTVPAPSSIATSLSLSIVSSSSSVASSSAASVASIVVTTKPSSVALSFPTTSATSTVNCAYLISAGLLSRAQLNALGCGQVIGGIVKRDEFTTLRTLYKPASVVLSVK